MPQQLTFAQAEYAAKKKLTRREQFLTEMEQVLAWASLQALIRPHYYQEEDPRPGPPTGRAGADAADVSAPAVVQPGR